MIHRDIKKIVDKRSGCGIDIPAADSWVEVIFGGKKLYGRTRSAAVEYDPRMLMPTVNLDFNLAGVSDVSTDRCQIKNVIFNPPATIVFWADGTKTVVKTQEDDVFDPEKGLAMAISKKALGNQGNYYNQFKKWTEKYEGPEYAGGVTVDEFIRNIRGVFGLPKKD